MSFMQPEVYFGGYTSVETTAGTEIIPEDISGFIEGDDWKEKLQQYCEGTILGNVEDEPERGEGYLYRLSAPGYLDCTSWGVASTEKGAHRALREMYADDEEPKRDHQGRFKDTFED